MTFLFKIPTIPPDPLTRSHARTILAGILILGAVLRFAYFIQVQSNPMPLFATRDHAFDSFNYVDLANDILDHQFLGSKVIQQSPVYPYLIAVIFKMFGRDVNYVFVFQMLWGLGIVYVFYRCAHLLFESRTIGLIAAFIAAVYSPFIYHECLILRDLPIGYMNLPGFYCLLRAVRKQQLPYYIGAGMALGLSTMLRPSVVMLAFLGVFFFIRGTKRKGIALGLLFLGVVLVLSPLAARNKKLGPGVWVESSAPETFWAGNVFDSEGIGAPKSPLSFQLAAEAGAGGSYLLNSVRIMAREVGAHPREFLDLYLRKFKMLLNGYEIPENFSYDLFKENHSVLSIAFLNFYFVSPLALVGMLLAWGKFRELRWLYFFLFVTTGFVLLFHIQGRYRLAFIPFFILFAAYALYWFYQMAWKKKFAMVGIAVAVLITTAWYTKPDHQIMDRYFGGVVRDIDYNNLVIAYRDSLQRKGATLTAAQQHKIFQAAIENRKKSVQAANSGFFPVYLLDLGQMYLQAGQYGDAVKTLSSVVQFFPGNRDVQAMLELARQQAQ